MAGGIHPHNKSEVARRLAISIRRQVFNRTSLPQITAAEGARPISANMLQVWFSPSTTSLVWGPTHNCSICCTTETQIVLVCLEGVNCTDSRQPWMNSAAHVVGGDDEAPTLQASIPKAATAVRYAWSNFPECVLFDENQLPVGPFFLPVSKSGMRPAS